MDGLFVKVDGEKIKGGDRIYYLTLKKKDISCYIEHEEFSEKWRIWIQKDDIFRKMGL